MALAQLLAAAHCWTPPARPPTFTRRELGSLGAAGLAAASSGGILLPASAGGIPPQPYEKQPGFKLNTGQAFPTASFGLQVYDDATAQKLTSLALEVGHHNLPHLQLHLGCTPQLHPSVHSPSATRLGHTPWPHTLATPPQLPQPHPCPCRSATATSSPPCSPRTRSASHAPSRRVAPPPGDQSDPAARPPAPKARGARLLAQERSPGASGAATQRTQRASNLETKTSAPPAAPIARLPTSAVPERASAPAALQRYLVATP